MMGACSAACLQRLMSDVTTSNLSHNYMGSWEVHSVVGLVQYIFSLSLRARGCARGGRGVGAGPVPRGPIWDPIGGCGAVLGCFGYEWGDSGWVSSIFRPVTASHGQRLWLVVH
jgi:hypothetical protein